MLMVHASVSPPEVEPSCQREGAYSASGAASTGVYKTVQPVARISVVSRDTVGIIMSRLVSGASQDERGLVALGDVGQLIESPNEPGEAGLAGVRHCGRGCTQRAVSRGPCNVHACALYPFAGGSEDGSQPATSLLRNLVVLEERLHELV